MKDEDIIIMLDGIQHAFDQAANAINNSGMPAIGHAFNAAAGNIHAAKASLMTKTVLGYLDGTDPIPELIRLYNPGNYKFPEYLYKGDCVPSYSAQSVLGHLNTLYGESLITSWMHLDAEGTHWNITRNPDGTYTFGTSSLTPVFTIHALGGPQLATIEYDRNVKAPLPFHLNSMWVHDVIETLIHCNHGIEPSQLRLITAGSEQNVAYYLNTLSELNRFRSSTVHAHLSLTITPTLKLRYGVGLVPTVRERVWELEGPNGKIQLISFNNIKQFLSMYLEELRVATARAKETDRFLQNLEQCIDRNIAITCEHPAAATLLDKLITSHWPDVTLSVLEVQYSVRYFIEIEGIGRSILVTTSQGLDVHYDPHLGSTLEVWDIEARHDGLWEVTHEEESWTIDAIYDYVHVAPNSSAT